MHERVEGLNIVGLTFESFVQAEGRRGEAGSGKGGIILTVG